jgi:hypothetical protein
MKPIDPQSAVETLWKLAPEFAEAKAKRVYLENFLRSKKAILMGEHKDKAIGAQEREAYAHPEYIGVIAALQVAVEREELLKYRMEACQMAVDIWRSQSATNRMIDRAAA